MPVLAERHRLNRFTVPDQGEQVPSRVKIPDVRSAIVVPAACESAPVWAEGDRPDLPTWACEPLDLLAAGHVEDSGTAIGRARREAGTIGTDGERQDWTAIAGFVAGSNLFW